MQIRTAQMIAFQPIADDDFIWRIARYLRKEQPDTLVKLPDGNLLVAQLPEPRLLELVRGGVTRARSHGLSWERSIAKFVVLMFVVAPNFDSHPLLHRVLEDDQIAPDERLDQFWEKTNEENWQAAVRDYDAGAWYGSKEKNNSEQA